jgi:hypothetical protein
MIARIVALRTLNTFDTLADWFVLRSSAQLLRADKDALRDILDLASIHISV